MHQIRFRLGLCPRPRWELTALPDPLAELRGPTSKGIEERGAEGREEKGRKMEREEREERGMEEGEGEGGGERRGVLDLPLKYMITLGEGRGKFSRSKVGGMFQSE